jgi:phage antirepressor YoqD-like protein
MKTLRILSIDAWANENGWDWNSCFKVGEFPAEKIDMTNRQLIKWFRDNEFISRDSQGLVAIEDDQYNIILTERRNGRPFYAIEYGSEQ